MLGNKIASAAVAAVAFAASVLADVDPIVIKVRLSGWSRGQAVTDTFGGVGIQILLQDQRY